MKLRQAAVSLKYFKMLISKFAGPTSMFNVYAVFRQVTGWKVSLDKMAGKAEGWLCFTGLTYHLKY